MKKLFVFVMLLTLLLVSCAPSSSTEVVEKSTVEVSTEIPPIAESSPTSRLSTATSEPMEPTVLPEKGGQSVVAWYGHVVGLPFGSQFDDYLALHPEGVGEVGIEGADDLIEAEIQMLRDSEGVGEYIHVWGTLTCDILDYGGCQLLVDRLRYGRTFFDPDPVEGWEGTITTGTFNMGVVDVFVLSGDFPMWYSIESIDPTIKSQLVGLRDTGKTIHVWGELVAGVMAVNGSWIMLTRLEIND
jgi:hypothetical protein